MELTICYNNHYAKKVFGIIFLLILLSCNSRIHTYKRSVEHTNETIVIDSRKKTFQYLSKYKEQSYTAKGNLTIDNSVLSFNFPPHAEIDSLSPFKKGYFELEKINPNEKIILHLSFIDLKWDFLFPNINTLRLFSITSPLDSFSIKKENPIILESNMQGHFLLIEDFFYYNQTIKIPAKGEYSLKVYLQQFESFGTYETTTKGCYYVVNNPNIEYTICKTGENGVIKSFSLDKTCKNPYEIINVKSKIKR